MRRYFARKDLISEIASELGSVSQEFAKLIPENAKAEFVEIDNKTLILINGEAVLSKFEQGYFPTVRGALKIRADRRFVTVDKGAVAFVVKGADVMRPGVVAFDENLNSGVLVIINEETHKKPIAIGISLWSGNEFKSRTKGKCVKNLHYVGDKLWSLDITGNHKS